MKSFITSVFLLIIVSSDAQQKLPTFEFEEIGKYVYTLKILSGSNIIGANMMVFANESEIILVDANLPVAPLLQYTEKKIKERFPNREITHISISHWHPDHSGGIGLIAPNSKVIAHKNVKTTLLNPQKGYGLSQVDKLQEFEARDIQHVPNVVFEKEYILNPDGESIVYTHLANAHTNGDIITHFKNTNIIHVGDIIWPNSFPFVDYLNGGTANGILNALDFLIEISNSSTQFVSGHGNILNKNELNEYREMVSETIQFVNSKISKGIDEDRILNEGLPSYKNWASKLVPERTWIQMILKST